MKGRILSIEAIHVIQALKRAQRTNPTTLPLRVTTLLPRLLKADLISTFKELLRQQQFKIALVVFSSIKSEYKIELTLYAELVNALTSKGCFEEVDKLVCEIVEEGRIDIEDKGLVKFVKALVEGERRESTVKIYGLLKKCGWGEGFEVDEYVAEVLSKGLRRMGEEKLADEIDEDVKRLFRNNLAKNVV
ncbi:hypothetical protein LIER_26869 [Lithospermum erythrorhizon]|uniref:Uncharacterized protein n=1 Tax=Lithospermum erythrorhizon TaxID=34254 RepID=A0AAV3RDZ1_LITER